MMPERETARAEGASNPLREGMGEIREAGPATVVIFGASGDLANRKLLPALYDLAWEGLLHPDTAILGSSRSGFSDEEFRKRIRDSVEKARRPFDAAVFEQLTRHAGYEAGDFGDPDLYERLGRRLRHAAGRRGGDARGTLFYFSTPPKVYQTLAANLGKANLVRSPGDAAWTRVIVEKPFGHDLGTARSLNRSLHEVFAEEQVFRIDHYLGKETVQNILVFRLGNGFSEPLWNSRYVDHVQITAAESLGVGTRGGFYDGVGVVRDMLQNHMMQLLTLVCMEPPSRFDAKSVRDEKVKVLEAVTPFTVERVARDVVRAQYGAGMVDGRPVPGYREEDKVDPSSTTETYLAARFEVENWRWSGTPFYLRAGKRLPKRATEISIVFKQPPVSIFREEGVSPPRSNVLSLRVQPEEGISLSFGSKTPGQRLRIDDVRMDFLYATSFGEEAPQAYERLLLEAMVGDSTLFAREDEVDLAWGIVDGIVAGWEENGSRPQSYESGTWGPGEANALIERGGRFWERL